LIVEIASRKLLPKWTWRLTKGVNSMKSVMLWHVLVCTSALCAAAEFEKPIRLKGGDEYVRVESPGWAAPCVADINHDGKPDLLVGQFKRGKIRVYKALDNMRFAAGQWLEAEGAVAEVPGVS
jgi:hypothetical protein